MNKQALTEALAPRLIDPSLLPIYEAARLVERLLPGECEKCQGRGFVVDISIVHVTFVPGTSAMLQTNDDPCSACHGSGQVWDEGIVEVVARAIARHRYPQLPEAASLDLEEVRAVLSALAGLLTEKVET